MGRAYDESIDLTKALERHFDPAQALQRIQETHEWLKDPTKKSDDELAELGWRRGYNLTVWEEMPGRLDSRAVQQVLLQTLTGGRLGITETGPGYSLKTEATQIRKVLSQP